MARYILVHATEHSTELGRKGGVKGLRKNELFKIKKKIKKNKKK